MSSLTMMIAGTVVVLLCPLAVLAVMVRFLLAGSPGETGHHGPADEQPALLVWRHLLAWFKARPRSLTFKNE